MAGKKSLPTREQADAAFLWHTQDIFESDEQFLKALERLKECAGQLSAFQGKLGDAKTLLRCLQMMEQTEELAGNVGSYAALKSDQDTANPLYQGYVGRVSSVGVELSAATAYFTPEIWRWATGSAIWRRPARSSPSTGNISTIFCVRRPTSSPSGRSACFR